MSQPRSSKPAGAEWASLRAAYASLESRLKEEIAAHARTRALVREGAAQADNENKLRLVLENMPVMLNAFDEAGVCVAWNRECEKVLGFSAEAMLGSPNALERYVPDAAYRMRMTAEWAGKGEHRDWEWEHTTRDGRKVTVAWSNISERFPVRGWATWGIGVDVTERNQALAALRAARQELEDRVSGRTAEIEVANERLRHQIAERTRVGAALIEREQHLQGVLDHVADALVTIDEWGTIESFNPSAEDMFGFSAGDAIGRSVTILMPDPDRSQHGTYIEAYLDTGKGHILGVGPREVTAQRKDGSLFPMELAVGVMELDGRKVFIGAMRDLSDKKRADAEIRESQAILSSFMDSATDSFAILDQAMTYVDVNAQAVKGIGRSKEDIVGHNFSELSPESKPSGRYEKYREVLRTGQPHTDEISLGASFGDGERRLNISAFPVGDGLLGLAAHDITDRVAAAHALKASEIRLLASQQIAHIGTLESDLVTDEVVWTDEVFRLLGLEPGAVAPSPEAFIQRVHPDDEETVRKLWQAGIQVERPNEQRFRVVWPDGSIHVLNATAAIHTTEDGRAARLRTVQDVTKLVRTEEDLRRSRSMFERAFEASPSPAAIVGLTDERLLKVNNAWCEAFGLRREQAIGKSPAGLGIAMDADGEERFRQQIASFGHVRGLETRLRFPPQGSFLDVEVFAEALEFEGGGVWFTVAHDRTAQKTHEEAIWRAKEAAENANRTKSEFLANVSHELRTPLNAVIGFAQALEAGIAGPLTGKQREYIRDIGVSGDHLLDVMSDIIDLSAVELGRFELSLKPFQLAGCIESCLRIVEQRARERSIEIAVDDLAGLPDAIADERRLKQVVLNLLTNAIKFTEPGGRIDIHADTEAGGGCTITVRDTGIGMDRATVQEALEVFRRGEQPMIRKAEGAGLGLPLANSIVVAHGGAMTIASEPRAGTSVTVRLPPPPKTAKSA